MNAILVKIFATALALSQVTTRPDAVKTHFDAVADLPYPFAQLIGRLDLSDGTAQIERVRPLSLNVKLRTPGAVRFTLSGGVNSLKAEVPDAWPNLFRQARFLRASKISPDFLPHSSASALSICLWMKMWNTHAA